jgi:L-fuculose-phosphate aldolase
MARWREALLRSELVAAGAALARRGLIRHAEGNISCRLDERRILITPRGVAKGLLTSPELVVCEFGAPPPPEASSEVFLHLEVYRRIPLVSSLVHAHPAALLALEHRGGRVPEPSDLREGELLVGSVALVAAHAPGSEALAHACAVALTESPVAVLSRHGVVAWGHDIWQALARVEAVELLAEIGLAGTAPSP